MLNIGNLVVDSLDYIMIVDKDYRIIYNTRYDAALNMQSQEYLYRDISNKNYFEMYPNLKKEDSSIVRALETGQIIINKRQEYYDYIGRRFVTNNVTFPLKRMGEIMAAVELAIDADENEDIQGIANKKFDEFVLQLRKDAGLITFDTILTEDIRMLKAIEQARILATVPNPVLIYGETGTGKELFAQSIINLSGVPKSKVVIQNCAAVPDNLMETILFGTVRGVYTGAENRKGLFEEADGGVLFLDEISSIPFSVQAKLLRVIQDGTFRPLGATEDKQVNVKVIGAMNIPPDEAIENNILRSDLFYRFSSGLVTLIPLRERPDDIKLFIRYYIDYFSRIYNKSIMGIDDEAYDMFMDYSWEGNVRELRNAIESMVVSKQDGSNLGVEDMPAYLKNRILQEKESMTEIEENTIPEDENRAMDYHVLMDNYEKKIIRKALSDADGNQTKAAEILGIPRKTLTYRIRKLGI